jgi:hypothetical protein
VRVEVTAEDIEKGVRNDSRCCAVARAAQRALGCEVRACWGLLELPSGKKAVTPRKYNEFIERFDAGEHVEPFSFTVSRP